MKIASINSYIQSKNNNNQKRNNPNFRGITDALIDFWQFIDNGGRALQFTAEDMTGTNIPRSIKGLTAGKKYTGHVNIPAFLQEALREFLTGPTMCITPFLVLTLAKKLTGKSANTHIENIKNLSYLLENTNAIQGQELENAFYNTVIKDMYNKTVGKDVTDESINAMAKLFEKFSVQTDKKGRKEILSDMQKLFEKVIKSEKTNYLDENFLTAKYSKNASEIGATKFKNYAEYATSFIEDFKKSGKSINQINNFKSSWIGKRFLTLTGMIFITAILMSQVPKIYTKASGKVNPNASVIYNEANKNKNADLKEVNSKDNNTESIKNNAEEDKKTNKASKIAAIAAIAAAAIGAAAAFSSGKQKPQVVDNLANNLQNVAKFSSEKLNKLCEKIGSIIGNSDKIQKVLDYTEATGANNSFYVLVGLMFGNVIAPRVITAAKRNPDDKEATKDEIQEILIRDLQTVLIILFALKSINAVFAGIASKKSGLPMTTKPFRPLFDKTLNNFGDKIQDLFHHPIDKLKIIGKNVLDVINPTAGIRALTNEEFGAKYSNYTFNELPKILDQVDVERGDKAKVFDKIIEGTIEDCKNKLKGNPKKGIIGLIDIVNSTINKNGKPIKGLEKGRLNAEDAIETLEKIKEAGINSISNIQNENVKQAITDFLEKEDNSLVKSGKGINAWLRTGALGFEAAYLGYGLPALNQKRLEKKYLKHGNSNDAFIVNNDKTSASLITKNIKAHEVKLYHKFIK